MNESKPSHDKAAVGKHHDDSIKRTWNGPDAAPGFPNAYPQLPKDAENIIVFPCDIQRRDAEKK